MTGGPAAATGRDARQEVTLALTGDVMLGRLVDGVMREEGPARPWDASILPALRGADALLVNLECALTESVRRWHDGGYKAFYFRADPALGVEALRIAGVDFASLANNHACDFGAAGMLDTIATLDSAGIAHAGAGRDLAAARRPAILDVHGLRVVVSAWADYPMQWAADEQTPGINYTEISTDAEDFEPIAAALREARALGDLVVFCIHWGPNMRERPPEHFRRFAKAVVDAGADVFWGHSAHIVQGAEVYRDRPLLYDTGDFVDDYMVDPVLRNDLGAFFAVSIDRTRPSRPARVELTPTFIREMRVERADGAERERFARRFRALSHELGTEVIDQDGRLVIALGRTTEVW